MERNISTCLDMRISFFFLKCGIHQFLPKDFPFPGMTEQLFAVMLMTIRHRVSARIFSA
ncbi:Uncharacterized protein EbC_pEb17200780 (plasmid) [Erwinia billingiae Eb661]|uniref:Uncharacterized protein n=1 Tax=Erwinia billingiae (strain Eb661) TaxID=634500 RepID=D8MJT3_ERWBE|nr:Uncharacterized protein EbC_pEb17200780 [Erwinia billingiae Eb661]